MNKLNSTHAPELNGWVESANAPDTDFPAAGSAPGD